MSKPIIRIVKEILNDNPNIGFTENEIKNRIYSKTKDRNILLRRIRPIFECISKTNNKIIFDGFKIKKSD